MALERLAWEYFVKQKRPMTRRRFDRLKAPQRIRRMLADHEIPLEIPELFAEFRRWAHQFEWSDIADAIAAMRNIIVHPDNEHVDTLRNSDDTPLHDVWCCGLWALELLLLRLFGYTGDYQDRRKSHRWAGRPDPLPWAKPAEDRQVNADSNAPGAACSPESSTPTEERNA